MRVLIVGAGIAGPTLAYFLAKSGGHSVTILEKSVKFLTKGYNIDIRGTALKVVEQMGLSEALLKRHTSEKGTRVIDSNGRQVAALPVIPGKEASLTAEFEILRGDLAELLYNATSDLPGVEYLFGTTVRQVISNDEESSTVRVELSNDDVREFDLLVGADGQWSKIRAQYLPSEWLTVVDKNMFMVYSCIPRTEEDDDWLNYLFAGRSRALMLRPDNHGTMRVVLSKWLRTGIELTTWREIAKGDRESQMKLMRSEFADAGWKVDQILKGMEASEEYYFQEVQQIRLQKWRTGRIVCIGDAAYAPTPLTGKGTSLALLGAYTLAGELSLLEAGEHPERALDSYEKKFRPFVEKIQGDLPSYIARVSHPNAKWEVGLLNATMRTMAKVMSNPVVVKHLLPDSSNMEDEGFPLPLYPKFEKES